MMTYRSAAATVTLRVALTTGVRGVDVSALRTTCDTAAAQLDVATLVTVATALKRQARSDDVTPSAQT